jgi:hypothetical protein
MYVSPNILGRCGRKSHKPAKKDYYADVCHILMQNMREFYEKTEMDNTQF